MGSGTIAVCGATGKQGGSVLDALINDGQWDLVALSRDPSGARAEAIRQREVEVRRADLMDRESLIAALRGVDAVYGVSTPETAKGEIDTEMELGQGLNLTDACVATDIQHLVMSTVMYVEEGQEKSLGYIRAKRQIEQYIIEQGLPHTFVSPASFMDEIGGEFLPVKKGVVTGPADNDARIPYAATRDIGRLAAMAFADRSAFLGRRVNLIGDFLSGD